MRSLSVNCVSKVFFGSRWGNDDKLKLYGEIDLINKSNIFLQNVFNKTKLSFFLVHSQFLSISSLSSYVIHLLYIKCLNLFVLVQTVLMTMWVPLSTIWAFDVRISNVGNQCAKEVWREPNKYRRRHNYFKNTKMKLDITCDAKRRRKIEQVMNRMDTSRKQK